MTKIKGVLLFLGVNISIIGHTQIVLGEKDFSSKNILSAIFKGEFQNELNVQKWPVSATQELELTSYVDANHHAYTSIDTIFNLQVDTNNFKIVLFNTLLVDSSGWIQDCMGCPSQIGVAYFKEIENVFELTYFELNLVQKGSGWFLPYSRLEQIGPEKYALVLRDEIVQDYGTEVWYEIFDSPNIFLSFIHTDLEYEIKNHSNKTETNYITNAIEIIKTENEYFDFILHTQVISVDEIDLKKAKLIDTKYIYNSYPTNKNNSLKAPFGYSILSN